MFRAYTGLKPYVFLSYAHKDSERIFPLMERLQQKGCNIWYDEGIHPADEWGDTIAKKIAEAKAVLVVISQNSVNSFNVKREIYYAVSKNMVIIPFYIEDITLPDGLDLQLGIFQAVRSENNHDKDCQKLREAFPKETVTGNEPTLLYKTRNSSYYFLQHSICGFTVYKYDHDEEKEVVLFKNEQPAYSEVESTISCYSQRFSYGNDFYSFNGDNAVLFNVFCEHVSDRFTPRFYLDYHFAIINPRMNPELKILMLKVKDYVSKKDFDTYSEENIPMSWKNQI